MKTIPVEKNKEYIVEIIDQGCEGEGISKIDGYTIFIPGAIKGEKVKILIVKVNTSYAYGKIMQIILPAESRVENDCNTYKRCGGCNLRHIRYEDTLELKRNIVQNLVNKGLSQKIEVNKVIGMEKPFNYRNKAQYPVGYNKNGEIITGIYAERTHDIIEIEECAIQQTISQRIAKWIIEYMKENHILAYNEKTTKGAIRHIVIKVGLRTKQIMCILVTNEKDIPKEKEMTRALLQEFKNIKTIVKNINTKNTNVILGKENKILYGR